MNVVWLSVNETLTPRGMWDQTLLELIFKDANHYTEITPELDNAFVIIPGAYQQDYVKQINEELAKLRECKVIFTSDEENLFPIDEIEHPNIKIYGTYPNTKYKTKVHWLPIGPARINENKLPVKDLGWAYSGQVNHSSRKRLVKALKKMKNGVLIETGGFSQGLPRDEYYELISRAKVIPAPKGVVSPDSFRLYEAMEAGAVPVTEEAWFWDLLFGEYPFPVFESWDNLKELMTVNYPKQNNRVQAWWQRKKIDIQDDLWLREGITVVMPTSPIKSHPSTEKIDQAIASVRKQLPNCRIIVTFDGVRKEQESYRENYEEYIRRFLAKYNNDNVYPIVFDEHVHQVQMAREALEHVKTDTFVYLEHDMALTEDYIDWDGAVQAIRNDKIDLLRFSFDDALIEQHKHMMMDKKAIKKDGVPLIRLFQWSQRPHIAKTSWYKKILRENFSEAPVCFIEDHLHGVVDQDFRKNGYKNFKLAMYHPEGSIKRSYHLDGREDGEKYDDKQTF